MIMSTCVACGMDGSILPDWAGAYVGGDCLWAELLPPCRLSNLQCNGHKCTVYMYGYLSVQVSHQLIGTFWLHAQHLYNMCCEAETTSRTLHLSLWPYDLTHLFASWPRSVRYVSISVFSDACASRALTNSLEWLISWSCSACRRFSRSATTCCARARSASFSAFKPWLADCSPLF